MKKNRSAGRKLRLEALEERRLLAVFTVDDDFTVDNPAARQFMTIQAAVDAASAGDKIKVRPGTYEEEVVISADKVGLKMVGPDPRLSRFDDPTRAAIVDPGDDGIATDPAIAFNVFANGVVIEGFTIGNFDGVTDPDGSVGIQTSNTASGYTIEDNVIENNSIGIYLNSATILNTPGGVKPKRTVVEDNVIRNNDLFFGMASAAGNGIYSDQGLQNAVIEDNLFTGSMSNVAITIVFDPNETIPTLRSGIKIEDNEFEDLTGGGIYFEKVVDSKIEDNDIEDTGLNGIQLNGANQRVKIEDNKLKRAGAGQSFHGIIISDESDFGVNTNITIEDNRVIDAGLSGIVLRDTTMSVVEDNTVKGAMGFTPDPNAQWGNGISLEDNATNNRIEDNNVSRSQRHGIFVAATATGNTIVDNKSKKNNTGNVGAFDYKDESSGAGTAGTANTYRENEGRTEMPTGLIDD